MVSSETIQSKVKFDIVAGYDMPSKWDIIPIHASDRGTFKYCRRQWAWSSPSRRNLIPKAEVHGIRENLWFGSGVHYALERWYNPLREDPEVTFESWFNLQWNGGLVSESELGHFKERRPFKDGNYWRIYGLSEILPNPDVDMFMGLLDLGKGMMRFYKDYSIEHDNFTVIATEHDFSVPVLDPDGNVLYAVDTRRMPEDWEPDLILENVFGPLMKLVPAPYGQSGFPDNVIHKQVHARGRMDLIIRDNETGRYGIKDYKTASRVDDDYFRHLDLDEQCTTYLTLGEVEALIYDLPYKQLEFITYEALFKGYPKPPTFTAKGLPSINRQTESTTASMFAEAISKMGRAGEIMFENDVKMKAYYEWLVEMGDKRFIWPVDKWRNSVQRNNARVRLYYEVLDMLSPNLVTYPSPRKEYNCLNCVFRTPCLQAEDGSDYEETLALGYEPNFDR